MCAEIEGGLHSEGALREGNKKKGKVRETNPVTCVILLYKRVTDFSAARDVEVVVDRVTLRNWV